MTENDNRFDQLIQEGAEAEFKGWNFSWLNGRVQDPDPFWSYLDLLQSAMKNATAMLDMGTGGGEFLAGLAPFENLKVSATESYPPNIPIAKDRLEPLGVTVYGLDHPTELPITDDTFDLVINRHEEYDIQEVKRVLKPNGIFLTQQVGGSNDRELLTDIGGNVGDDWALDMEVEAFSKAGFKLIKKAESFDYQRFLDIGAVVYYLRAISWAVPDFSITSHREQLEKIHNIIESTGNYPTTKHRFLIEAHLL